MTSFPGIEVDPNLLAERQESVSCFVVTEQKDEASAALLAVRERLFLVDGDGREYPNEEALMKALAQHGHHIYTPNAVSEPEARRDGVLIWLDTKGDTSAEMASTMISIIAEQLVRNGVEKANLRPSHHRTSRRR